MSLFWIHVSNAFTKDISDSMQWILQCLIFFIKQIMGCFCLANPTILFEIWWMKGDFTFCNEYHICKTISPFFCWRFHPQAEKYIDLHSLKMKSFDVSPRCGLIKRTQSCMCVSLGVSQILFCDQVIMLIAIGILTQIYWYNLVSEKDSLCLSFYLDAH